MSEWVRVKKRGSGVIKSHKECVIDDDPRWLSEVHIKIEACLVPEKKTPGCRVDM